MDRAPLPRIINLIAIIDFERRINLPLFFEKFKTQFEIRLPKTCEFPAAVVKLDVATLLLFPNGKCICTGINEKKGALVTDGDLVIDPIIAKISGIVTDFLCETFTPKYNVVNIVTQMTLPQRVNLARIHITQSNCVYEPETFPALIVRTLSPRHTFLVFSSGKVIAHIPHPKITNGTKFGDVLQLMADTIVSVTH